MSVSIFITCSDVLHHVPQAALVWATPICLGTDMEYVAVRATPTSDRTCLPVTSCPDGTIEEAFPTASSDRVCVPIPGTVSAPDAQSPSDNASSGTATWVVAVVVGLAVLVLVVVGVALLQRRRGGMDIKSSSHTSRVRPISMDEISSPGAADERYTHKVWDELGRPVSRLFDDVMLTRPPFLSFSPFF